MSSDKYKIYIERKRVEKEGKKKKQTRKDEKNPFFFSYTFRGAYVVIFYLYIYNNAHSSWRRDVRNTDFSRLFLPRVRSLKSPRHAPRAYPQYVFIYIIIVIFLICTHVVHLFKLIYVFSIDTIYYTYNTIVKHILSYFVYILSIGAFIIIGI